MNSLDTHMALFEQLLEAANVDLRIAAGEALVVLYESAYDHDDEASLEMVSLWKKNSWNWICLKMYQILYLIFIYRLN